LRFLILKACRISGHAKAFFYRFDIRLHLPEMGSYPGWMSFLKPLVSSRVASVQRAQMIMENCWIPAPSA
jgi:hypothetical protein